MDIADTTDKQLQTLANWLKEQSSTEPPSELGWKELIHGMQMRATFIETFVLPELANPIPGRERVVPLQVRSPIVKFGMPEDIEPPTVPEK